MHFYKTTAALIAVIAQTVFAGPIHVRDAVVARQNNAFSNFASSKGSQVFGNAGLACSVGRQDGECDQFGRCAQFIPPNENSILNQGRPVATCTAGGVVDVL
ncbi:hypothetical protein B0J11DRAFT_208883 [Dendryphion nanum]|uniref:Uncharacterized protein n=1 Tax=Dendryphion nanum TaxID=256645 RepID=A0A9P9E6S0_9PLEO|nr:hypothetical protein B0J11DRAFT_208883 [Dendryphion nanum]